MYKVCGLRMTLNFGVRLQQLSFAVNGLRNSCVWVFTEKYCDYVAVIVEILRLRLTAEIQTLKYKVKSLK